MNKKILAAAIRKPPTTPEKAYIFVNDNRSICEAVITVGFLSLYISKTDDDFFTEESLSEFIRHTADTGTNLLSYVFVLACYRKKTNDNLERVLKNNLVPYKAGAFTLFKDKEYLAKYEKQGELEERLQNYISRFEGREAGPVDKQQFCTFSDNGAVKGIKDIAVVNYLKETVNMFVTNRELYLYSGGCYVRDLDGIRIKARVAELIPERFVTYRNLTAIYNLLLEQQELQRRFEELNAYPPWWINFRNGMFDVKEQVLHKHKPEYLAINQIPHELDISIRKDLEAAGRVTNAFLEEAIPNAEDRIMLWEYIGYSMTRDASFQKMLIIRGVGGTGKSRVINLIQDIVGEENCSNISLQDLNAKFYPSLLYGKLLNTCADIASDALLAVDNIKKATGEDVMIYERKGKDPQSFRSYAKLIFSANRIPLNLDEKSNAFYRRLLILEMNQKPKEKDMELGEKLRHEIGYCIWMAVGALKKLYRDGEFAESEGSREAVEELYREADTVKAFADECLEYQNGSRISRTLIYEKYVEYCKSYGRKYHSPNPFYKSLAAKGYQEYRTADGRFFRDVTLKDDGFLPVEGEK